MNLHARDRIKKWDSHAVLNLFPIRVRNRIIKILIALRIIRRYGHATFTVYREDGSVKEIGEGYNVIVDDGLKALADLSIGVTTNTINNMTFGTSSQGADPIDTDMIAAATPAARIAVVAGGRLRTNKLVTVSVLIPTTNYTRPVTIREMGPTFDPNATGKLFARAVITAVTLATGETGRAAYEIQY